MLNSCKKSLAVICGSSLGLVSAYQLCTSADSNFVEPGVATIDSEKKVGLGSKIYSVVTKAYAVLCALGAICGILRMLYIIISVLLSKASVIFGKIVNFLDFLKFKLFSPFNFRIFSINENWVFNLRTKDGKKLTSLNEVASKGKDKVKVKGENKKDGKDRDVDFIEFNLENLSMEEEDIDTVGNEYTSEDMSPYGWKNGEYTEEEEKRKIQEIHDWVDGKDIFEENEDIDNDFEKNFESFRRGYRPKEGCCYVYNDSKEMRDFYQSNYIVEGEEVLE